MKLNRALPLPLNMPACRECPDLPHIQRSAGEAGIEVLGATCLHAGPRARVYRVTARSGEELVAKVPVSTRTQPRVARDFHARQELVDRHGLAGIPGARFHGNALPRVFFFEYVPGDAPDFRAAGHRRALARFLARLHRIETIQESSGPDGLEAFSCELCRWRVSQGLAGKSPRLAPFLPALASLHEIVVAAFKPLFEGRHGPFPGRVLGHVHGDLDRENCVVGPAGGLWVVDWEFAARGDVLEEVTRVSRETIGPDASSDTPGSTAWERDFLDTYQEAFPAVAGYDLAGLARAYGQVHRFRDIAWLVKLYLRRSREKNHPEVALSHLQEYLALHAPAWPAEIDAKLALGLLQAKQNH